MNAEIAAERFGFAGLAYKKARVPEGQRGRQELIELGGPVGRRDLPHARSAEEHARIAHAEIAAERMEFLQVEVDEPGILCQTCDLVLAVIAVGQPAVVPVIVSLAVDGTVPGLLLVEHDLAVSVDDVGHTAGAGTRAS